MPAIHPAFYVPGKNQMTNISERFIFISWLIKQTKTFDNQENNHNDNEEIDVGFSFQTGWILFRKIKHNISEFMA